MIIKRNTEKIQSVKHGWIRDYVSPDHLKLLTITRPNCYAAQEKIITP